MKFLQLLVPSLFPLIVIGQINIVNKTLVDTTKHQLYKSIENTIIISGAKRYKNIMLKANKVEVVHLESTVFILRPFRSGLDTLRLFANNKLVYIWPCIIDTIPNPIVRIANQMDTILTVRQILFSPFLSVHFPETNWDHRWRIYSFSTVIAQVSEGNEFENSSPSSRFTNQQMKIFQQLKKGDKILFENIRGGGPDSRTVKFPSFIVLIK